MDVSGIIAQPLLDIAEAVGLVSPTQQLDPSWFENPLGRIETILTNSDQRGALFDLLDQVLPPAPVAGASTGAKWHPLLGNQAQGNVYLTVDASATPVVGLGAQYSGGPASLLAEVPVLALGGGVSAIVGTASGPVRLALAVQLGWTRPAHAIALAGISIARVFAPAAAPPLANAVIVMQGLDLDGSGAKNVTVDPATLGGEATTLIIGLIRDKLDELLAEGARRPTRWRSRHI